MNDLTVTDNFTFTHACGRGVTVVDGVERPHPCPLSVTTVDAYMWFEDEAQVKISRDFSTAGGWRVEPLREPPPAWQGPLRAASWDEAVAIAENLAVDLRRRVDEISAAEKSFREKWS